MAAKRTKEEEKGRALAATPSLRGGGETRITNEAGSRLGHRSLALRICPGRTTPKALQGGHASVHELAMRLRRRHELSTHKAWQVTLLRGGVNEDGGQEVGAGPEVWTVLSMRLTLRPGAVFFRHARGRRRCRRRAAVSRSTTVNGHSDISYRPIVVRMGILVEQYVPTTVQRCSRNAVKVHTEMPSDVADCPWRGGRISRFVALATTQQS